MDLEQFIGIEESKLEESCTKVIRYMRGLRDTDNLGGILLALQEVERLFDILHVSIVFSVVSMTNNIHDAQITMLCEDLTERVRLKVYNK